ncbi:hypothetical protein FHL15_009770 [Xylaria flabelliformis]|uniref:Uncharacterized protein n=1 Tax=Xylaria flabelliformis TaxID=2512241 RepID=A0A553HMZ4_9PEZI|nr:hypothetical protein FHL15_009770 [Xylaria flabelliformis]
MPSMAGTLGLHAYGLGSGLWEMPFAAPVATFLEDWFALQYLLPLISFVCVGLEGWCFFDLTRKSLGARSARAIADARDAASLEDYDVIKDFPRGGFEPSNNQLCVHGLLGIKLHARHTDCPSKPTLIANAKKAQERDVLDRNLIHGMRQTRPSTLIHHQSAKKITALSCHFDEKGFLQSKVD